VICKLLDHTVIASGDVESLNAAVPDGVPSNVWVTGAPVWWQQNILGTGTVVGVIDTGIDDGHPDLKFCPDGSVKMIGRRDYVNDGATPDKFHYHGTHCAGTVAANGRIKGVAPGAKLRDYRVLGANGSGSNQNVIQAVRDAADDGCHIISMSLGSSTGSDAMHTAIKYAVSKGCVVVVAVGNEGPEKISYPGYYKEVVGVGAIWWVMDKNAFVRAWFSNTNDQVDVCSVGVDVLSCAPGGKYMVLSGTSMATPAVAGYAALKDEKYVARLGYQPSEQTRWEGIKSDTVDVDAIGIDAQTGAGFVTAYPALPAVRRVGMTLDEPIRNVDGFRDRIDVAPVMVSDRMLSPMRHTHEPMNDIVSWNQETKTAWVRRWLVPGSQIGQPTNLKNEG